MSGESMRDQVHQEATRQFGEPPKLLVRAPGRVNLIGEHTDYNDGFVLPMAIDRATWMAVRPRKDRVVALQSLNLQESASFSLDDLRPGAAQGWVAYAAGVAGALLEQGFPLRGLDGVIGSEVPLGAGLSSSAALELAIARGLAAVSGIRWEPLSMALICQRAEDAWVGLHCGIMDQLIGACGVAGHALLIDCRDLQHRAVPLPSGVSVVVLDTGKRRGLVESAYNERQQQCAAAAAACGVKALRDLTLADLSRANLDLLTVSRARHVITENMRTFAAAEAMDRGDAAQLGASMNESHESLRRDFAVSCPELDQMVGIARSQSGCVGARMTGAGFGGCAIALVEDVGVAEFIPQVVAQYTAATGLQPALFVCRASKGAEIV